MTGDTTQMQEKREQRRLPASLLVLQAAILLFIALSTLVPIYVLGLLIFYAIGDYICWRYVSASRMEKLWTRLALLAGSFIVVFVNLVIVELIGRLIWK